MKTTLFCIFLLLSGIISAQTIDNPPFKARSGSISNITRIERTPENTRVYIHAIFRPHWWIMEDGDTYLEDAATGKKYMFKSAEGIELKKKSICRLQARWIMFLFSNRYRQKRKRFIFSIRLTPKAIFTIYRWYRKRRKSPPL